MGDSRIRVFGNTEVLYAGSREVDVNALILETAKLLRPTLGEQIQIEPSLAPDASAALVDPSSLPPRSSIWR